MAVVVRVVLGADEQALKRARVAHVWVDLLLVDAALELQPLWIDVPAAVVRLDALAGLERHEPRGVVFLVPVVAAWLADVLDRPAPLVGVVAREDQVVRQPEAGAQPVREGVARPDEMRRDVAVAVGARLRARVIVEMAHGVAHQVGRARARSEDPIDDERGAQAGAEARQRPLLRAEAQPPRDGAAARHLEGAAGGDGARGAGGARRREPHLRRRHTAAAAGQVVGGRRRRPQRARQLDGGEEGDVVAGDDGRRVDAAGGELVLALEQQRLVHAEQLRGGTRAVDGGDAALEAKQLRRRVGVARRLVLRAHEHAAPRPLEVRRRLGAPRVDEDVEGDAAVGVDQVGHPPPVRALDERRRRLRLRRAHVLRPRLDRVGLAAVLAKEDQRDTAGHHCAAASAATAAALAAAFAAAAAAVGARRRLHWP